ncbi:hypothetical protein KFE98_19905 [bacterium SCSIO 12741]|nr:hypothetical protein KFE98_19905 [bacterium SCSIO 12741]
MAEEKDPFFDLFREEIDQVHVEPSEEVWNSLENRLTRKKRRGGWFFYLAGLAAVASVGLVLLLPFPEDNPDALTDLAEPTKAVEKTESSSLKGRSAATASQPTTTENQKNTSVQPEETSSKPPVATENQTAPLAEQATTPLKTQTTTQPENVADWETNASDRMASHSPAQSSTLTAKVPDIQQSTLVSPMEQWVSLKPISLVALPEARMDEQLSPITFNDQGLTEPKPSKFYSRGKTVELQVAALFGQQQPFNPEDVPSEDLFVSTNRVSQKMVNSKTDGSFNWSIGARGGIQLFKGFYFTGGIQYDQWSGKGYTYYNQVYENRTVISVEHWAPKTVERVVEQTEGTQLTTNQFNNMYSHLNSNQGTTTFENDGLIGAGTNFPAPQKPKTRVITETIYTVENTEITVIDHASYDDTVVSNYRQQVVSVPLQLRWMWQVKRGKLSKLGGFLGSGVSLQALNAYRMESHSVSTAYENNLVNSRNQVFKNTDALFSLGLSYQLDPRTSLFISPEYRVPMGGQRDVSPGNSWRAAGGLLIQF